MAQQYDSSSDTSKPRPKSYQAPPPPPTANSAQPFQRPRPSDSNIPPSQPINDAVSSALNSSADASGRVDPNLVAQITEQVINSLKAGGMASPASASSQVNSHSSANPPQRNIVTPPSPDRSDDAAFDSASPPSHDPRQMDGFMDEQRSSQRSPERPTSPPSQSGRHRPTAAPRAPTDDTTTLEKIWQPLFAADGTPTARLGQFLQGLAIHIIADFEPLRSIVIPPQKMLKFYEAVKVPDEIYPWDSIFGGKMTNSSLSHLYRDLKCQHHYIQSRQHDKPNVPALTPLGFETWMIHMIRAHPETEYNRFAMAVLNMPISNAENAKERFPKELSRRLFPKQADLDIQIDLEDAILADPVIELTPYGRAQQRSATSPTTAASLPAAPTNARVTTSASAAHALANHTSGGSQPMSAPPPQLPTPTQPAQGSMENQRQHHSCNSSDTAVDDSLPSVSIERERKPYYAQPGGGKVYDDHDLRPSKSDQQPHQRSYTTATATRPVIDAADDYNVSPRYRTGSLATGNAPQRRYRSPSANGIQAPHSRSETDMPAGSYGSSASNLYPDYEDEGLTKTYSSGQRPRRYRNDEPSRDYGPPPPPPPPTQTGAPLRSEYEEELYRRAPGGYNQHYPPPTPRYG